MLPVICSAAFLVFAQAFMVAPLFPALVETLHSPLGLVGLAVPAYLLSQGVATLVSGPLSDRLGRREVILAALLAFTIFTLATASATSIRAFLAWRVAAGISAAGVVPISLTLIGDVVPFQRRGRALGWLFGSIAGGTATGASVGALLEPVLGWASLFALAGGIGALVLIVAVGTGAFPRLARPVAPTWSVILRGYAALLSMARAQRTYAYVLINAVVQSGVYTWLGIYLHQRFGLGEIGIGLALLGYGVPGVLFGPLIGRLADHHGRARIIPAGVALTGVCALLLAASLPLLAVQLAIIALSLGFDLTQPLLAGIVTDLRGSRGQAVALMAFTLFIGFGLGSLLFQWALALGFAMALTIFGVTAVLAAGLALALFRGEQPHP
ncbi:MAG: MFS transporter [Rhodanobacter sp.]|nr:MAG: MFS transporter [Rhodanobacter sp.]TAL97604.1 MAG: MFS transporter [Rhodanobacter sp.]TAM39548.1 MAG: MFS transporter [Rhodanobacter sp.]TAN22876.1 MAG: MFS transporter [Rhodanobacter sp.]